jgi:hypothetical protein
VIADYKKLSMIEKAEIRLGEIVRKTSLVESCGNICGVLAWTLGQCVS